VDGEMTLDSWFAYYSSIT